jgi:hypothetical protein
MCKIKSGIVLKDRVFCPLDYDSHEEMLKELKLDDKTDKPDFVRVEIVPKDGNIFNHDLKNWVLKVDQDYKPEWFSEKFAEEEMKGALEVFFKERFITSGKIGEINQGRWFLGGSAQVKNICGSAQVKNICGSAQVENIYDSAQVKYIYDSAQVKYICGSAQVKYIYGRSVCCFTGDKAKWKTIKENGIVILYYKEYPEIIVANKEIKLTIQE